MRPLVFVLCLLFLGADVSARFQETGPSLPDTVTYRAHLLQVRRLIDSAYRYLGNHSDTAIAYARKAGALAYISRDIDGQILSYIASAEAHTHIGDYAAARTDLSRANRLYLLAGNKESVLVKWFQARSFYYKHKGHTDSAMAVLQQALPVFERVGDTSYKVRLYNLIGSLLIDNQDYEEAGKYIARALAANTQENMDRIISYTNMGYVYSIRNELDSMYLMASELLKARELSGISKHRRTASIFMAKYYLRKGDREKADLYARNAELMIDPASPDVHVYVYGILAAMYKNAGLYGEALRFADSALSRLQPQMGKRNDAVSIFKVRSQAYDGLGRHMEAYAALDRYVRLTDSIHIRERAHAVDRYERQFRLMEKEKELAQKEKQIALQQKQVARRSLWIVVTVFTIVILSVLLVFMQRQHRRKLYVIRQRKEIDRLKAVMEGEEKERNRIAVDLHDNVSSLLSAASYSLHTVEDTIRSTPQEVPVRKLGHIIEEVRKEIRRTSHALMPDVLISNGIAEAVRQYGALIGKETGLFIHTHSRGVFEVLPKDMQLHLYRMIQELIQNVLKHAQAGQVMIQLHTEDRILSVTVEDDGVGFEPAAATAGRGLDNIRSRLQVLQGSLSVSSEPGKGASVYIEVQLP